MTSPQEMGSWTSPRNVLPAIEEAYMLCFFMQRGADKNSRAMLIRVENRLWDFSKGTPSEKFIGACVQQEQRCERINSNA